MSKKKYDGVRFFSIYDLSCAFNLQKAEDLLQSFSSSTIIAINQVIELYNITLFFDNKIYLVTWDENKVSNYTHTVYQFRKIIAVFFSKISPSNIDALLLSVDTHYIEDFWSLFVYYKVFNRFSESDFASLLNNSKAHLYILLQHKKLVFCFGDVIADSLRQSNDSAELLVAQYLEKNHNQKSQYWFPIELSPTERELLLYNYVNSADANPNLLSLIAASQGTPDLPVSDKLKLEARKKYDNITSDFFSKNTGLEYGVNIGFSESQEEYATLETENILIPTITYSLKWLKDNLDAPTLLNNFIYLFEYTDLHFRSNFVSLPSELSIFETTLGIKGVKEYVTGIKFDHKHLTFSAQMAIYYYELHKLNIHLESIFKWFFEEYLLEEFQVPNFTFDIPTDEISDLVKCKLLASEIDSILKQFSLFAKEGYIDRELFEISSVHMKIEAIPSFHHRKYCYPKGQICKRNMFLLFSDQSPLAYNKKFESSYDNFYSLMQNESVNKADFQEYQISDIDWLVQQDCLFFYENGKLALNIKKSELLWNMYYMQVSCFYYLKGYAVELEKMEKNNEMEYGSSLFSKPEQQYLNYVLNKAEFSNGLDLRNKYIHGTHSLNSQTHKRDYIEFLKTMVLIIIKINEELCLRDTLSSQHE